MKRILLAILFCSASFAQSFTKIVGPVSYPDGAMANGSITLASQSFTAGVGGGFFAGGAVTKPIVNGVLNPAGPGVSLQPGAYAVYYALDRGRPSEYWVVPTSSSALTISQVRTGTIPSLAGSFLTNKGDLLGHNGTAPARFPIGSDGYILSADSTQPVGFRWILPLTNPMTGAGDIIIGGASGAPTRLPPGSSNQALIISGGLPAWGTLSTTNITEGSNFYYLDSRARGAFSATAPILYNSGTGAFLCQTASGSQPGCVAAADFATFNGKQPALGFTPLNPINNLSDILSAATARANLGLGSAATQPSSAFQSALGFTPENVANKDGASGYAGLTAGGLLKNAEFPAVTGDVTISSGTTVSTVAFAGGSSAANIHSAELLANAATNLNTASAIVRRDPSGNFSAGTITASLTGLASLNEVPLTFGAGLSRSSNAVVVPNAGVTNAMLFNPSLTVAAGTGLTGGGVVALGSSVSVSMPGVGTAGTYTKVTTDAQGRVSSGASATAADVGAVPVARVVGTTGPLAGGGDLSADRTLSIPAATSSIDGYLWHTDWATFNGKQNALGYTPLNPANNLSEVTPATARTNLGLGTAATQPSSAFEPAITAGTQNQVITGLKGLLSLPHCPDTGGNHWNYDTTTHLITCGASGSGTGAVASVFGRTGAVVSATGDYTAAQVTNAVDSTGSFANPAWITSLAASKVGNGTAQWNANQINGVSLSGLATGLLKNTTTTGVPSIAIAGTDYENPLSFTSPLVRTSNTVVCQTATGSLPGCISAADWTTFNGKQPAGSYLTAAITSLNGLSGATQTFTNDTNVTIVSGGTAHVITWAGALTKARQHAATVYTDQVNTYVNQAAPATPASGSTALWNDSTDKNFKAKNDAGSVSVTVQPASAVSHQFVTGISSAGVVGQAQPAAADISGLAPSATTDTTNASNISSGTLPNSRLSAVPNAALANSTIGITAGSGLSGGGTPALGSSVTLSSSRLVNAQTGTSYAILDGDRARLVTFTNAASIAASIPQAGASSLFISGWFTDIQNRGAGTLTLTPTTSTIDGAATLALTTNQGVRIFSDGTNYFTQRGVGGGGGGGISMLSQAGDLLATRTSSTVLTIGANCSISTPCNVRFGSRVFSLIASATATISAGTGTAYVYVTSAGTLTVGHNVTLACSGCTATAGVTSFPLDTIPLFSWSATSGAWDVNGGTDQRAAFSTKVVQCGSGLICADTGAVLSQSVDMNAVNGRPVNPQTSTSYTFVDSDRAKLVTFTNASAIAGALPQAGASSQFSAGWFTDIQNRGAGTLTLTPTTSTIDGAATLALTTNQGVRIFSDGTNYFTQRGVGGGGGGTITIVEDISITAGMQNNGTGATNTGGWEIGGTATAPSLTGTGGTDGSGALGISNSGTPTIYHRRILPSTWISTGGIDLHLYWADECCGSGSVKWTAAIACAAAGGNAYMLSGGTTPFVYNAASSVTTATGGGIQPRKSDITGLDLTNCGANTQISVKVFRDNTVGSNMGGTAKLLFGVLTFRRTNQ